MSNLTEARLRREAATNRRRLRDAEAALAATRQALAAYQEAELRRRLAPILASYDDFDLRIGRENVIDERGRIDDAELNVRIRALLTAHPHLAARQTDDVEPGV